MIDAIGAELAVFRDTMGPGWSAIPAVTRGSERRYVVVISYCRAPGSPALRWQLTYSALRSFNRAMVEPCMTSIEAAQLFSQPLEFDAAMHWIDDSEPYEETSRGDPDRERFCAD